MTRQEANKIVYEMGYHPYSGEAMVDALMKGVEIGRDRQKAIDDDHFREATKMVIDKACSWLKENLGYYNRNEVHIGKSYEQCVIDDFRKAMEEE